MLKSAAPWLVPGETVVLLTYSLHWRPNPGHGSPPPKLRAGLPLLTEPNQPDLVELVPAELCPRAARGRRGTAGSQVINRTAPVK